MGESSENIFSIEDPQEYFCIIWRYSASHSVLLVRVNKGELADKAFYLCFELVQYFEGPLRWKGANFCVGAPDECIELLHRRGFKGIPKDKLLDEFRLFTVELPDAETVKILAARNASKTEDIPLGLLTEKTN